MISFPEWQRDAINKHKKYLASPKAKFNEAKQRASHRGIDWNLTFNEWWSLWSDYFHKMGPSGYMLCRIEEPGPYSADNVYIGTAQTNQRDRRRNKL